MSTNYEWQKLQVEERVNTALKEADSHRKAYRSSSRKRSRKISSEFILGMIGAGVVIFLLLTGCTPVEPAVSQVNQVQPEIVLDEQQEVSQAERIRFKDRLWEGSITREHHQVAEPLPALDLSNEGLGTEGMPSTQDQNGWSMAERIRFQDQLSGNP